MVDRFTFRLEAKMPCLQSMAAQSSLRLWESSHLGKAVNGCSPGDALKPQESKVPPTQKAKTHGVCCWDYPETMVLNKTVTPLKFNSEFTPDKYWDWKMINFLLGPGNFPGVFAVKLEGGNTQFEGVQPFGLHTCSIFTYHSIIHPQVIKYQLEWGRYYVPGRAFPFSN